MHYLQATATVSIGAGTLADYLQQQLHWPFSTVRKTMQATANLGSLFLLPLIVTTATTSLSPLVAVCSLTAAQALQGFNYSGFHSYVQDVAPSEAGLVLGITNSCGTLAGIGGNVLTGYLAETAYGFKAVFALTLVLCMLSTMTWLCFADGKPVQLYI